MNKLDYFKPVPPMVQAILACHHEGDSRRIGVGTDADGDVVWARYVCTRPMCSCPGSWQLGDIRLISVMERGTNL
jgi:hypothetical protein